MTPEMYDKVYDVFQVVFFAEVILLVLVIAIDIVLRIIMLVNVPPEIIYYFQNCNNLTLYPDGCQVFT